MVGSCCFQVHEDLMGYLRDQQRELTERVEAWTNKMANDTARLDSLRDALTEVRRGGKGGEEDGEGGGADCCPFVRVSSSSCCGWCCVEA